MINYIVLIIISIISILILAIILKIDYKKIKEMGMIEELNKFTDRFPQNIEICREMLKKINNEKVKVEENLDSKTSLYIALSNKILIADIKNSYTRIQTIAHECIHSIQDRQIQLFNFFYSNVYLIYFFTVIILNISKIIKDKGIFITIFLILSLIYFVIRAYLENDAMIKARFLAKEYIEEKDIISKEEAKKIIDGYDNLNNLGIKCVNFSLILEILIKVIILSIVALIF